MRAPRFISAPKINIGTDKDLIERAKKFYATMQRRRTIRDFSDRPVSHEVIEYCIRAAGTAPNGANLQPWHFVAVSDPAVKREIRIAAEAEEKSFTNTAHQKRGSRRSLLSAPIGTNRSWNPRRGSSRYLRSRFEFYQMERARRRTTRLSQLELPQVYW